MKEQDKKVCPNCKTIRMFNEATCRKCGHNFLEKKGQDSSYQDITRRATGPAGKEKIIDRVEEQKIEKKDYKKTSIKKIQLPIHFPYTYSYIAKYIALEIIGLLTILPSFRELIRNPDPIDYFLFLFPYILLTCWVVFGVNLYFKFKNNWRAITITEEAFIDNTGLFFKKIIPWSYVYDVRIEQKINSYFLIFELTFDELYSVHLKPSKTRLHIINLSLVKVHYSQLIEVIETIFHYYEE